MIFLDTSFLIQSLVPGSAEGEQMRHWLAAGEAIGLSTMVWAEFLCGPVSPDHVRLAAQALSSLEPLLPEDAAAGAELFNATGRRRGSLADCLIAASCLRIGAFLATLNLDDFRRFMPMGLQLLPMS
jgi:predicted nucleic acid-binding protein